MVVCRGEGRRVFVRLRTLVCALALVLLGAASARAQTYTWTGAGGDALMSNPANWQEGSAPSDGPGVTLLFDPAAVAFTVFNDFPPATQFGTLRFTGTGVPFTLSGNPIVLHDGIVELSESGGSQRINLSIEPAGDITISAASNAFPLEIAGPITGAGNIFIDGPGMVSYVGSAANPFTGATNVSNGRLFLGKDPGVLAISGSLTIGDDAAAPAFVTIGASEQIADDQLVAVFSDGTLMVDAPERVGPFGGTTGGVVALMGGPLTLDIAGSSFPRVTFIGSHDLIKRGAGLLALPTGSPLFDGDIFVEAGTVVVQAAASLGSTAGLTRVLAGATLMTNGVSSIAERIELAGGRLVSPDPASATITGPVQLLADSIILVQNAAGTLTLGGEVSGDFRLTKQGIGALALAHAGNTFGSAMTPLTIAAGAVRLDVPNAMPSDVLVSLAAGTTFDLGNLSHTISGVVGAGTIALGSGTLRIAGIGATVFDGVITGSGGLVLDNPVATLTMGGSAPNTYTGTTAVLSGTLALQKAAGMLAIPGPLTIGGSGMFVQGGTVAVRAPNQIADTQPVTIAGNGLLWLDGADETIGPLSGFGGSIVRLYAGTTHAPSTLTINIAAPAMFHGVFDDGGFGGGLAFQGADENITQTLTGVSSFTGPTTIQGGSVAINGTHANSPVTVIGGGVLTGTGYVGDVTVGGASSARISPAGLNTIGVLHTGSLTIHPNGTLVADMRAPVSGTGYDQIIVNGTVTLHDAGTWLEVVDFAPTTGQSYMLISNTGANPVSGIFANFPEGHILKMFGRWMQTSYVGGDGNDVVMTDVTPPVVIDPATLPPITAGEPFTLTLVPGGGDGAPYTLALESGTLPEGLTFDAATGLLAGTPTTPGPFSFTVRATDPLNNSGTRTYSGEVLAVTALTYYLSEGATGSFFDEELLLANPGATDAPVTLTFARRDGVTVTDSRIVRAHSRLTVRVDDIPGLEATEASVTVRSEAGVPLAVERSMFWDMRAYAGHASAAVPALSHDWLFAEGAQGFFDTFVLIANPQAAPADVTLTFMREGETPFVTTMTVAPMTRQTVAASAFEELRGRSFGLSVHATQPIVAERAMYFASTPDQLWRGGAASAGVTAGATSWTLAEGATGSFFDTFVLLSNPQASEARATLRFLLATGETVTTERTIPPNGRVTVDIEQVGDPRLADAPVATVVTSDLPIVAERSMYWSGVPTNGGPAAGETAPWTEAHNSFGASAGATRWTLAEARSGGALAFHTYLLLANPQATTAQATVTYLPEEGGTPVVRTYELPPSTRTSVDVNAIEALAGTRFGIDVQVTNGVPIVVERSMYWNAGETFWSGGSNAPGVPRPE